MEIAVLFADVRGSTQLGEELSPIAFAQLLNRFYRVATDVLLAHGAVVDKLVGDEVMALFIPGICGRDYRLLAVQAAETLMRELGYARGGSQSLPVGVGAHAGEAFVGNVGSGGVKDFTALGDTVNSAARLQGEARAGEVVLSDAIYGAVEEHYPDLERRVVTLRGREAPMAIRILRFPDER